MAASQARLLSITARIHDVEYQAQALQNAKVQLSTQSDQAYEDYNNALNATTLTISTMDDSGQKSTVAATFNNLASSSKLRASDGSNYALVYNNSLLVEDDVYKGYQEFKDSDYAKDGYHFAMYMLGGKDDSAWKELKQNEFNVFFNQVRNGDSNADKKLVELFNSILSSNGNLDTWNNLIKENKDPSEYGLEEWMYSEINDEREDDPKIGQLEGKDLEDYHAILYQFKTLLYQNYAAEIFSETYEQTDDEKFKTYYSAKFNNYVDIFNQIKANGGNCRPISEFNGPSGDAANNSEWLKNMVESGVISIYTVQTDSKTGEVSFNGTSPSSDHSLNYTDTTSIDKRALVKAEAEYNKKLKDIDRKDKQYDLSLSRLETERSALTTEYDSVKKVIEDNIERTFGIFS